VGLSSAEIRRRNFLQPGQTTITEQVINDPIDLGKLLNRALELAHYDARRARFAEENGSGSQKKGMGIAAFLHGAGFTGSGERYLASVVGVEGCADGGVKVLASSTEFGQGTNTVLCQIAAEALHLPYENVHIAPADTNQVPNSGPTVASRTAMVVGNLVASAALGLKQTLIGAGLLKENYTGDEFHAACQAYLAEHGTLRSLARYESPQGIYWDDQKYRGEAYAAFAWAVYIAQVTVDLATYQARANDFVALQEIGRVMNPVLARGQILGGVAQGIGFALYEKVEWREGRMANSQITNYIIPTSADVPPIRVYFEEMGNPYGAFGAKGIGELPMDGPAPAVVNAIEDALGIPFDTVPLVPETILEGIERAAAASKGNRDHLPAGVQ
jgi:CO/xanthine dehydrogenase Mo-binding subunit